MLCPVCKTWTSWWRNWIPQVGAILALATFIATGVTYVGSQLRPRVERLLAPQLSTSDGFLFLNAGNLDLFVVQIDFESVALNRWQSVTVGKLVPAGQVVAHALFMQAGKIVFITNDHPTLLDLLGRPDLRERASPGTAAVRYVAADTAENRTLELANVSAFVNDASAIP